jgi:lysophospholipase L1-like esterase
VNRRLLILSAAIVAALPAARPSIAETKDRWEAEISRIEERHRKSPPPPGGILFAGSSSIRLWDLASSFPGLPTLNQGFGGSTIADNVRYAPRLIIPFRPKTIVFYAGDNDIANGRSPEGVAEDFSEFVRLVHKALPETRIHFISIKPSPKRWSLWTKADQANRMILDACAADPKRLEFVDIRGALLGSDGQPRKELFVKDELHLSDAGYAAWTRIVRESLTAADGRTAAPRNSK